MKIISTFHIHMYFVMYIQIFEIIYLTKQFGLPSRKTVKFQKTEPSCSFWWSTASGKNQISSTQLIKFFCCVVYTPFVITPHKFLISNFPIFTENYHYFYLHLVQQVHLLSAEVSVFQAANEPGRLLCNNSFSSRPRHWGTPGIVFLCICICVFWDSRYQNVKNRIPW